MNNPNCGACGMLNSRGFCSLTACRFPVVNGLGTWQERILANKPKQTNADLIRQRSDEELAEYFSDIAGWLSEYEGKAHALLKWLKAPAEEVEG